MSVDLDVTLGYRRIAARDLEVAIRRELTTRFAPSELELVVTYSDGFDGQIGLAECHFTMTLGVDASIEAFTLTLGPMPSEDRGWYASFSPRIRSPESRLLMVIAVACLARLRGEPVIDDAGYLRLGELIEPDDLLARIGNHENFTFEQAAKELALDSRV